MRGDSVEFVEPGPCLGGRVAGLPEPDRQIVLGRGDLTDAGFDVAHLGNEAGTVTVQVPDQGVERVGVHRLPAGEAGVVTAMGEIHSFHDDVDVAVDLGDTGLEFTDRHLRRGAFREELFCDLFEPGDFGRLCGDLGADVGVVGEELYEPVVAGEERRTAGFGVGNSPCGGLDRRGLLRGLACPCVTERFEFLACSSEPVRGVFVLLVLFAGDVDLGGHRIDRGLQRSHPCHRRVPGCEPAVDLFGDSVVHADLGGQRRLRPGGCGDLIFRCLMQRAERHVELEHLPQQRLAFRGLHLGEPADVSLPCDRCCQQR